jgi:hypothetical protein
MIDGLVLISLYCGTSGFHTTTVHNSKLNNNMKKNIVKELDFLLKMQIFMIGWEPIGSMEISPALLEHYLYRCSCSSVNGYPLKYLV